MPFPAAGKARRVVTDCWCGVLHIEAGSVVTENSRDGEMPSRQNSESGKNWRLVINRCDRLVRGASYHCRVGGCEP